MNDSDAYMKAMYGQNAVHSPCWMYAQHQGDGQVLFVGSAKSDALRWGSQKTHQFMLGEIIARPHFACASDVFRGRGSNGLLTADHAEFIHAPDMEIICDPMGKLDAILRSVKD